MLDYEAIIFQGYTETEIKEIKRLMSNWAQATYPSLAHSIVDHGNRHNFEHNYLKYLRKADNFNKKGAKRKILLKGAIRWNKGNEFIIERDGKIISYGIN